VYKSLSNETVLFKFAELEIGFVHEVRES